MPTHDRANGRFVGSEENLARDAEALRLRSRGWTYQQIADELGYYDRRTAYRAVEQALKDTLQEPAENLRKLEVDRLDEMYRHALAVVERQHVAISQGRVVRRKIPILDSAGEQVMDPHTDEPMFRYEEVLDDAPLLAALDRLLKIQERRARLLGLDAPARSRVEVVTQDQIEVAIENLERQIAERERELANGVPGQV